MNVVRAFGRGSQLRWQLHHPLQFLQAFKLYRRTSRATIAAQLERHARLAPHQVFLLFGERSYTYAQANALVNQHAHAYAALGVRKGEVVALWMENRPEYLWHFFGLLKIGAVASLINSQNPAPTALAALRSCPPCHIVIGSELWPAMASEHAALESIAPGAIDLDVDPEHPCDAPLPRFAARLPGVPATNPKLSKPTLEDEAALIFTSGTTGMPKAAIIRHERFYRAGRLWASAALSFRQGDVLYNCLPLYHSSAILLGTASAITARIPMALARKFSATHFWDDVRRYGATSFLYIGELCRYLLSSPPSDKDRQHGVRVMTGNGLRADVWAAFQQRFAIERVSEFYASTEGNCITINVDGAVGSCGPLLPGMALVRWDAAANDVCRNQAGFLERAGPGEVGLLLGRIRRDRRFDGYTDREASQRKILRDVFKPHDAWFNSGDLLRLGSMRRLYFVDRLGDTFRWQGQNVATAEVEAQLARWPALAHVSAYGVPIPGTEGRACMATLVLRDGATFDAAAFHAHVTASLPSYARPLLLRISASLAITSTFKVQKRALQHEGYDPAAITDPLYLLQLGQQRYVPLDAALHQQLCAQPQPVR